MPEPPDPLERVRQLCLAMPGVTEVLAHGESTFRVQRRMFVTFASAHNHHGAGRPAIWVKATHADQAALLAAAPERFFVPPYVGPSGWVGMWLDRRVSWRSVATVLGEGWRQAAAPRPRRVRAR